PVLDHFHAAAREAIDPGEGAAAEGAAGVDGVGKPVEHEPVGSAPQGRDDVRVVPPVLGEDQFRGPPQEGAGEGGVKERGILVGVDDLDVPLAQFTGHPPGAAPIASGAAPQVHDGHTLGKELLAEGPDGVETEYDGVNLPGEAADGLRDENLGPGHLHDVHDEVHAQGPTVLRLSLRARSRTYSWT